jgi:hypothetical protein
MALRVHRMPVLDLPLDNPAADRRPDNSTTRKEPNSDE